MNFFYFLSFILLASSSHSEDKSSLGSDTINSDNDNSVLSEDDSARQLTYQAQGLSVPEITEALHRNSQIEELQLDDIEFNSMKEFNDFMDAFANLHYMNEVVLGNFQWTKEMCQRFYGLLETKNIRILDLLGMEICDFNFPSSLDFIGFADMSLSKLSLASLANLLQQGAVISFWIFENVVIEDESLFISVLYNLRYAQRRQIADNTVTFELRDFSMSPEAYKTFFESVKILTAGGKVYLDLREMNCTDDDLKPFFELAHVVKSDLDIEIEDNPNLGNVSLIEYMKFNCLFHGHLAFDMGNFGLIDDSIWQMLADNVPLVPTLKDLIIIKKFDKITADQIFILAKAALSHPKMRTLYFQFTIDNDDLNNINALIETFRMENNIKKKVNLLFDTQFNAASPGDPPSASDSENQEETSKKEESSDKSSGKSLQSSDKSSESSEKSENSQNDSTDQSEDENRRRIFPPPSIHHPVPQSDLPESPVSSDLSDYGKKKKLNSECPSNSPFSLLFLIFYCMLF